MSRPPRCPFQSRAAAAPLLRFPSLGSIVEEQPEWLDELLSEPGREREGGGGSLRRTVSDPVSILDAFVSPVSVGTEDGGFVYGPNSPRGRCREDEEESSMVSALLENGLWGQSRCFADLNGRVGGDVGGGVEDAELDKAATRRRSGQRSRVRKLQYIAELERNVEDIQALGAELAAQVGCLFQQRVALSMENKKLRQKMIILQQQKIIKEGQYKSLTNEAEKLKMSFGRHRRSKSAASCFETGHSGSSWQMELGKLSLGGSQFL